MTPTWKTLLVVVSTLSFLIAATAEAQVAATLDEVVPPGRNFDKAEFRLWLPKDLDKVRATVILLPGSNGDARTQVQDTVWQSFASRHGLALLGCRFTDKLLSESYL